MDTQRIAAPGRAARPYIVRGLAAGAVTLGGLVLAGSGQVFANPDGGPKAQEVTAVELTLAFGGALLVLAGGITATRCFARAVRSAMQEHTGDARGAALGTIVTFVGYSIVILSVFSVLGIKLQGLLLGGALTGVVFGIAAQQTLGNFFAGMVLLMVRPFTLGDYVVLRSSPLGGEYEGTVTDMSLFYVRMLTKKGPVVLPNAGVLAAAVGPGARSGDPDPEPEEGAGQDPAHPSQ
ncbi:MAG TPA: mechanosensitive ion channel family protein [Actinomycetota bacterium]|nr:mechanosensitive ion channel family protein [Actinomycetota bacterium]